MIKIPSIYWDFTSRQVLTKQFCEGQKDILLNRSIKDALVAEEKFFRTRPVYNDIADHCGVPQLAKKLNKGGKGALILNILSKYSEAFSSMIEGKNGEMATSELSGGARIHYIFQNIFVKCLEDMILQRN